MGAVDLLDGNPLALLGGRAGETSRPGHVLDCRNLHVRGQPGTATSGSGSDSSGTSGGGRGSAGAERTQRWNEQKCRRPSTSGPTFARNAHEPSSILHIRL